MHTCLPRVQNSELGFGQVRSKEICPHQVSASAPRPRRLCAWWVEPCEVRNSAVDSHTCGESNRQHFNPGACSSFVGGSLGLQMHFVQAGHFDSVADKEQDARDSSRKVHGTGTPEANGMGSLREINIVRNWWEARRWKSRRDDVSVTQCLKSCTCFKPLPLCAWRVTLDGSTAAPF